MAVLAFAVTATYALAVYPWLVAHGRLPPPSELRVAAGKVAVAAVFVAGSWWSARLVRRSTHVTGWQRVGTALAFAAGLCAYVNFGTTNGWPHYVHTWDVYHYYLGSKYASELGYTELYRCTVIADAETSPMRGNSLVARRIRDLETGGVEMVVDVLAAPQRCKQHFSPERWHAFRRDVAFFRGMTSSTIWSLLFMDHGYQPPPAWTMIGGVLANAVPASYGGLRLLTAFDLALDAVSLGMIYWAFGRRAALVALFFLGCEWPANAFFMGGTFLRHEWLAASTAAVCLAARQRWVAAGAALGAASVLRVVPVFFFGAWLLGAIVDLMRRRKGTYRKHLRFAAGAALSAALLVGGSAAMLGPRAYVGFYHNVTLHARTALIEQMGLQAVLSYAPETSANRTRNILLPDQYQEWRSSRVEALSRRRPVLIVAMVGTLVLVLAAAARARATWARIAFGVILAAVFANIACYYYMFCLLLAPFARASRAYGVSLVVISAISSAVVLFTPYALWEERYVVESMVFVGALVAFGVLRGTRALLRGPS